MATRIRHSQPPPELVFRRWYARAEQTDQPYPNAMTLATVGRDGAPSARMVLMKAFDAEGVVFFTNTRSRKGRELAGNPRVALVFWWKQCRRQVRIEGRVAPLPRADVAAYFATRPRGSCLGAWASPQSALIASRRVLTARYAELAARFRGKPVPCPPHWGGYRVRPERVEFWTDRKSRLHDRIDYVRDRRGRWITRRLAP